MDNHSLHSIPSSVDSASGHQAIPFHPQSSAEKSVKGTSPAVHSRSNSSSEPEPVVVPRKERRGLLSSVVLIPELENARAYSMFYKYVIVAVVSLSAITGPMGTSIMMPAINDIITDLNTTDSIVNVSVGIYLISFGIFPLWWSSMSEKFGRRSVYMISFTLFFIFSIGTSVAPTIGALIALRVMQGGCSASVQAVGAGTIADLFEPRQRGRAMGYYFLGPLCGPFLAPIIGGAVAQGWGWRATQWTLVIVAGVNTVMIFLLLPETLSKSDTLSAVTKMLGAGGAVGEHTVEAVREEQYDVEAASAGVHEPHTYDIGEKILERVATELSAQEVEQAVQEHDVPLVDAVMPSLTRLTTNRSDYSRKILQQTVDATKARTPPTDWRTLLYDVIIRPVHSLVLLRYPPVGLVVAYSGVQFANIFFFNLTISYMYSRPPYNFSSIIVGLMYIPNSVTYILASVVGGRWNDWLLRNYAKKHNGQLVPEARISWNIVTANALFPPAFLIFGWCIDKHQHWVTPLIGTAIFGFASMLLMGATATYLVDTLPGKGATGIALNNLVRQVLAAVATFVVAPALQGIGPGILFSILIGIMMVWNVLLLYLKWRGDHYRDNYDVAALYAKL
ncbi:quinidine resistance protein 3 [Diutina catenulata]